MNADKLAELVKAALKADEEAAAAAKEEEYARSRANTARVAARNAWDAVGDELLKGYQNNHGPLVASKLGEMLATYKGRL